VFWVHASSAARIEQGYRDIADQVRLAGRNDPQADVFKLVHNWLRNEKNGKWLLVLDNADEAAALTLLACNTPKTQASSRDGAHPRLLSWHLPRSKSGSVLVTSRTRSVALQLLEERDILSIQPMDDASGPELLRKKLGEEVEKDYTTELARALEFMPLALVQAAAYIQQRAPRCSVQKYLEEFHKSDRKRTGLLDYDGGHLRRDEEAKNSILITWQISFDHILEARPSAADLLSLMSFFDWQGIPEALLRNQNRTKSRHRGIEDSNVNKTDSDSDDSNSEASVDDGFEEDILTLRNYSLIGITTNSTIFDMHGLVQLATRKWLEEHGRLEMWKQQYISNLCKAFPTGEHENWAQCQVLFPHAKAALSQPPKSKESLQQWALLLYNTAWYTWRKGNISDAKKLSTKSMKVRKKLLGTEHIDTLNSTAMVGLTAKLAGQWKEAEELEVQVMETSLRVLGEEHPDTLVSMGNLASTYGNQGRWKEAEELQEQALEKKKKILGEDHLSTLISMGNLASTYKNHGRWKEAEELEVQALEKKKRMLGEEHLETLISIDNLAMTYRNQGRWKEAEELQEQVLETSLRVLGEEHPSTLISMSNLALTYKNQGRWKEAEDLEVQALEKKKRMLGEEHLETLISIDNLALTYRNQGRWKEAEELQERVLETSLRVLGEEHPDTLISIGNLALTYKNQGRWKEAEELQVQVLETRKRVLGEEYPGTLVSMGNLASTYGIQGRWKEAEELQVQVLETRKRVLGEEHPDTLLSMGNLAFALKSQSHHKEALSLMEACSQLRKQILGEQHPYTKWSLDMLNKWQVENIEIDLPRLST
jgi:tetratricopeptide (TPR) repeat protein